MHRPNVILITVDSLRPDRLGCYGYRRRTSPHIDRLAEEAVVFDSAFATGPNTPHSFMGIMASQEPFHAGELALSRAPMTMAELFRRNGYHTQGFNAGNPWVSKYYGYERGFDEMVDFLEFQPADNQAFRYLNRSRPEEETPCPGGAEREEPPAWSQLVKQLTPPSWRSLARSLLDRARRARHNGRHIQVKQSIERAFMPAVLGWIRDVSEEPFFLWVHLMTVHEPYVPPFVDQIVVNRRFHTPNTARELRAQAEKRVAAGRLTDRFLRQFRSLYDAEIHRLDRCFGQLLDLMDQRGLTDRTITILCADHGEEFGEHGGLFHECKLYDELLRVPLIVHLPGHEGGRRVTDAVSLADLLPTAADLLGLQGLEPRQCDGRSLAPALAGRALPEQVQIAQAFYDEKGGFFRFDPYCTSPQPRRFCVQNGRLKLICHCSTGEHEIYDLQADPLERKNLAKASLAAREAVRQLQRAYVREAEARRIRNIIAAPASPGSSYATG